MKQRWVRACKAKVAVVCSRLLCSRADFAQKSKSISVDDGQKRKKEKKKEKRKSRRTFPSFLSTHSSSFLLLLSFFSCFDGENDTSKKRAPIFSYFRKISFLFVWVVLSDPLGPTAQHRWDKLCATFGDVRDDHRSGECEKEKEQRHCKQSRGPWPRRPHEFDSRRVGQLCAKYSRACGAKSPRLSLVSPSSWNFPSLVSRVPFKNLQHL
jgi:hypothetical protein